MQPCQHQRAETLPNQPLLCLWNDRFLKTTSKNLWSRKKRGDTIVCVWKMYVGPQWHYPLVCRQEFWSLKLSIFAILVFWSHMLISESIWEPWKQCMSKDSGLSFAKSPHPKPYPAYFPVLPSKVQWFTNERHAGLQKVRKYRLILWTHWGDVYWLDKK